MYSRTAINDMLTELAAELPRLLRDRQTFVRMFEDRSEQIRRAAAPEDRAYVIEVLQAFVERSGISEGAQHRHVA